MNSYYKLDKHNMSTKTTDWIQTEHEHNSEALGQLPVQKQSQWQELDF